MFRFENFIVSAPPCFQGLSWCKVGQQTWRPREVAEAIDRSVQCLTTWGRTSRYSGKLRRMPNFISAYMALLAGQHPEYVLRTHTPWPDTHKKAPPVPVPGQPTAERVLKDAGIEPEHVNAAFDLDPVNRRSTSKLLFNDGVAWAVALLMMGRHPHLSLTPRHEVEPPYKGRVVDPYELLDEVKGDLNYHQLSHELRADIETTLAIDAMPD